MERKEELAARQKNFFNDRESLSQRMTALDKEVYRLNAQRAKLQEMLEKEVAGRAGKR